MNLWELGVTQKSVLAILFEAKWHNPRSARMDDATYMTHVITAGWCLNPACPEPPFHCHWPQTWINRELRRLLA